VPCRSLAQARESEVAAQPQVLKRLENLGIFCQVDGSNLTASRARATAAAGSAHERRAHHGLRLTCQTGLGLHFDPAVYLRLEFHVIAGADMGAPLVIRSRPARRLPDGSAPSAAPEILPTPLRRDSDHASGERNQLLAAQQRLELTARSEHLREMRLRPRSAPGC